MMQDDTEKYCFAPCDPTIVEMGNCSCNNRIANTAPISIAPPEYFTPTAQLRMNGYTLEQMWQGSQGTQEWKLIPQKKH